eukprot:IDg18051t1
MARFQFSFTAGHCAGLAVLRKKNYHVKRATVNQVRVCFSDDDYMAIMEDFVILG